MLKNWQTLGLDLGEAKQNDKRAAGRLLASAAFVGAGIRGIVGTLSGVTSITWILGMTTLGAFLAITAKIVDQALY